MDVFKLSFILKFLKGYNYTECVIPFGRVSSNLQRGNSEIK